MADWLGDRLIAEYGDEWHGMSIYDIAQAAVDVLATMPVEERMAAMRMVPRQVTAIPRHGDHVGWVEQRD